MRGICIDASRLSLAAEGKESIFSSGFMAAPRDRRKTADEWVWGQSLARVFRQRACFVNFSSYSITWGRLEAQGLLEEEHDHSPRVAWTRAFLPGRVILSPRAASPPSVTNLAFFCVCPRRWSRPTLSLCVDVSFVQKFVARALPESICGIRPCLDILLMPARG